MYKDKYGDNWFMEYCYGEGILEREKPDYNRDMKHVNTAIYYGYWVGGSGNGPRVMLLPKMQEDRMHELFGDKHEELQNHPMRDSRIAELLIADAIKTGKWKEFPDELQDEYHKRISEE